MLEGSARSYRLSLPPSTAAVSRVEAALASAAAAEHDNAHEVSSAFLTGVHESGSFSSSRVLDVDRLAEPLGAVVLRLNEGDCCGEMGGLGVCELQLQIVTIELQIVTIEATCRCFFEVCFLLRDRSGMC